MSLDNSLTPTRAAEPRLAEYECVLAALFGDWHEVGHLALAITGAQFQDTSLGQLYDLAVLTRFDDPSAGAFELRFDDRLSAQATAALADLLLWARTSAHAPQPRTFAAALEVVALRSLPQARTSLVA